MTAWRQMITSLLLLALLAVGSRLAGQAIADDEILPVRPQPQAARALETLPGSGVGGQGAVTVDFVKKEEILPPGVMFFNVFKIQNTGDRPALFTPTFTLPAGAHLIIQEADQGELRLSPGEAKYMPVRVSFPADAAGGVSYEITGQIRDADGQPGAAAHTTVEFERTSRWQLSTPMSKVYASSVSSDYTAVQLFLSNKGNARETIQLLCEAGDLLKMEHETNGTVILNVPLRPATDTVLLLNVLSKAYEGEGSAGDRSRLRVRARSHPDSTAREVVVIFDTRAGTFRNQSRGESPLSLHFRQSDVGAKNSTTMIGLEGTVLLNHERTFRYELETQQQMLDPQATFNPLSTQLRVGYETPEYVLQAGFSGGVAGLSYQRKLENRSYRTAVVRNFNTGNWDFSGAYQQQFSQRLTGKVGASLKTDKARGSGAAVADIGARVVLAKGQRLSLKTTGSYALTAQESGKAPGQPGWAYDLGYNLEKGRLKLNATNQFASKNFAGTEQGTFRIDANALYEVRPDQFFKLVYANSSRKSESLSKLSGIPTATKISNTERLAANYNFSVGNLPFAIGASYSQSTMRNHLYARDTTLQNSSRSYGASAGTTIMSKKNGDFSLSPSVQVGMARATQNSWQDVAANPASYQAKMSLKGNYKQANISADYELSSTGAAPESGMNPATRKRFQVASGYLLPLVANKLALNASAEMAYDLNSKEVQTQARASLDYDSGRDWSFQVSTRFDPLAKSGGQSPAVSVAASRSFDMPQPRLKYYNLKVLFFKDFNGNRLNDEGDEGIGNVLVEIERVNEPVETAEGMKNIRFEAPALMSDPSGKVVFQKAPQGNYLLKLEELFPRMAFTNLYGANLDVLLNKHVVVLVPYTESVTITGKVDITRDKYSRLVGISAKNIRITVTDPSGDQYHTLTSPNGDYIISVPYAEHYQLSMKNVLGDKFDLTNGEQELKVEKDVNRYEMGFLFQEKGRSVNFGN